MSRAPLAQRERWLLIDGAAEFGGHEVMLLRLAEEIAAHGRVTPLILARSGSALQRRATAHAAALTLPADHGHAATLAGLLRHPLAALRDALALARAIRTLRPTLCIVAEGCVLAQPVMVLAARLLRQRVAVYVPLTESSHKLGFGRSRLRDALVQRFYANLPHAWITITAHQAAEFATWAHVRRPIFSLPNTVERDIDALAGHALLETAEVPPAQRVLVLGRLDSHQKGLDQLIAFLSATPALRQQVNVSLVGKGPYEAVLRTAIEATPALDQWINLQPWADPAEAMRNHDVLLIASRYEGVPLVMLEAMALGLPVVASDLPGTRAFLPENCLFGVGDLQRAFRIIAALRDPLLRQRIVQLNRLTYAARASSSAFTAAVNRLTGELCSVVNT